MIKVVISEELTCPHCELPAILYYILPEFTVEVGAVGTCYQCKKKFTIVDIPYSTNEGKDKYKTQCEVNTMRSKKK